MKNRAWVGQGGRVSVMVAAAVALAPPGPARGATNIVRALGPATFGFSPSVLNITVGDTVLWTNASSGIHDVSQGTIAGGLTPPASQYWSPFLLPTFNKGTVTFSNIGSYPYLCNQHVFINPQPPVNPTQTGTVNVLAFNFPPTVNLTGPALLVEPATVTVSATASDPDGTVTNIQLFIGSNLVGAGTVSPVTATISGLPGGNYTLTAKAVDNLGATNTSAPAGLVVQYRVAYSDVAYSPFALKIKPGESILFTNQGGAHTVSGTGSQPFCGSALVAIDSCAVTLPNAGTFPYECAFHSSFGMTGAVTVAAFNRAPLARLTSPAPNSVLIAPATVALRAEVFDPDGSVTGVQFANGNALVNSDSTPPFAFTLTNMAPGSYSFTVRAGDNLGLRGTSAPVNVTVVAPLQLSGPAVGGGGFQFRYTADPGSTYVVEGSASPGGLSPFLPLATNVAGNNVETFMDPAALTLSNRAYRVFKQP